MAGSGARRGWLYGFWVGLPACVILVVVQSLAAVPIRVPTIPAWLIGLPVSEGSSAALVIQGVQALVLGPFGGWLGSLTLPPDPGKRPGMNR